MSSSNQPLRYDLGISKDLVLYLNTKIKLNPIKQKRTFSSVFFVFLTIILKQSVLPFSENLLTYLSVLVKIMVKWKGLENG